MAGPSFKRESLWWGGGLLLAYLGLAVAGFAYCREISRDEHQFVAAAALWAREGLIPYLDFPHFHVPYLIILQGAFQLLTGSALWGSRLVNILGGVGILFVVWGLAWRSTKLLPPWERLAWSGALTAILAGNTLFLYTSGMAWNHDLAILGALGALLCLLRGLAASRSSAWWIAGAGFLLTVAALIRLSVAPLGLPFLLAVLWPRGKQIQWKQGLVLALGAVAAALPFLVLFALAPQAVWHDVFVYAGQLTTQYWRDAGGQTTLDWPGKLAFLWRDILGQDGYFLVLGSAKVNLWLLGAVLILGTPAFLGALREGGLALGRAVFLLACLGMTFLGATLPSPNMDQYYCQVAVLLVALAALGLGRSLATYARVVTRWGYMALLLAALVVGLSHAYYLGRLTQQAMAQSIKKAALVELTTEAMASASVEGTVLTLSPAYPLEAGASIDPGLAPGPFAFRTAYLVPEDMRRRLHILGPEDLEDLDGLKDFSAMLTGAEPLREEPLISLAHDLGWRSQPVGDTGLLIWLPPSGN